MWMATSLGSRFIVPNLTINGASHNVVYVATEHDSVYAFDADGTTTTPLWKVSFLVNGATTVSTSADERCGTARSSPKSALPPLR